MEDNSHQNKWAGEQNIEKLKLIFLMDMAADKMWKTTGCVEDPSVPAFAALRAVFSWRSTS